MARFSATSTPSASRSRTATTKRDLGPGPGSIVDIAGRKLKLSPVINTLFLWMTERHAIHQRRLAGQPWPWTDDPILQQHAFTNVFRIYDRVTQYIICNVIGKGDQNLHETCFRVILFRCFNRISTWELLLAHFGELTWRDFNLAAYEAVLYEEYKQNNRLYGASYILPAPELGGTSLDESKGKVNYANHLRLLKVMMETDLPGQLAQLSELSDAWERISLYPGMGAFLSSQYVSLCHLLVFPFVNVHRLLLDLNMIPELTRPEDWAICGPGAESCLLKIFGPGVKGVYNEALNWLQQTQDLHFARLGISQERRPCIGSTYELSPVDFEHSLCECDVYSRKAHPEIKGRRQHIGRRNFSANRPPPPSAVLPSSWCTVAEAIEARARMKRTAPPPVDPNDPDPAWALSHIVKQAPGLQGKMLYRVRYDGYGPEDDLWLPESDLVDAPELLAEWQGLLEQIKRSVAACRAE
jgi:alpha-glutamyl/putrescinyl thymine pyrophosphorylase clade 1